MRIKGLVHWRRLVHTACNRFKIMYAQCIWILIAIPAYHVKRMVSVPNIVAKPFLFYFNKILALLVYSNQFLWLTYITLTKGRMLQQLPIFAQVPFRKCNRTEGLNNEQTVVIIIKLDLIDSSPGYYQVVTIAELDLSVLST